MSKLWEIFNRQSIRTKIFIPFFLVTAVFAMLVILWASHVMKQDLEYRFIDSLYNQQRTVAYEVEEIEKRLLFYGQFMADVEKLSNQFPDSRINRSILIYTINFLRSHNKFSYLPGSGEYADEGYNLLIQKGRMGLHTSSVIERVSDGKISLSIDAVNPIETPEGVTDVVIISYPLTKEFLAGLKIRTGADVSLIYKNRIILSTLNSQALLKAGLAEINKLSLESLLSEQNTYLTEWGVGSDIHKALLFPLVVNYKTWGFFAVSLPLEGLSYIEREIYAYTTGFALIMLAIIGFMYSLISRKLTYPIKQLSKAANYMAKGDLAQRVEVSSADEVGNLQSSFNVMAENLQGMHDDLTKSNQEIAEWSKTLEQKVDERAAKLREIEQQLNQAEKLSAIGELVSGVAHEINNPLSTIIGFAQIMEMDVSDEQARQDLNKIAHEAKRASKIVKNLLTYARKEGPYKKLTQINELIIQTLDLRAYELRVKSMDLIQDLDPALEETMVDPNQIKQVLLNIINNAMVAVEVRGDKARIELSTHQHNGQIIVKLSDNGEGIPEENLPKIFDPFYTTKEVGQGTGLGLSVSYGIIKEHGGDIEVESEAGRGSTFIITLPLVKEKQSIVEKAKPKGDGHLLMGKRVLVIDDELDALNFMKRFLQTCGCLVDTAANGRLALEKLCNGKFDVIVCDMRMPVMDGKVFYERLSAKMPEMLGKIVFATGDLVSRDTTNFIKSTGAEYVTKPFDLADIKNVLCRVTLN